MIEAAGRRFKRDGIDSSGISALMKDSGLTNGAFYRHFTSKDDLAATAVADQLRTQNASIVAQAAPGRVGLARIVRWYPSARHRDSSDDCCPSAALLDEIRRRHDPTRQACTEGVLMVIDGIAARLAPDDPLPARTRALSAYTMTAGTLQLSVALADQRLADELLEQGIHNALTLGVEDEHARTAA
ncbi:TetR/AcrR family transcriptional regulator [Streptomyces sp. NPDC048252]|uniref:TetR/AcrR family transcriptional regulator n=1 Tax=Streptomyces sp. NPDC048252 TaxID=3154612 RepID=UPI00342C107F